MSVRVTGNPTPEELAAVLALLTSSRGAVEEPEPAPVSLWADRAAMLRQPLHPGRGAWRAGLR